MAALTIGGEYVYSNKQTAKKKRITQERIERLEELVQSRMEVEKELVAEVQAIKAKIDDLTSRTLTSTAVQTIEVASKTESQPAEPMIVPTKL